jgi:hypothetical protein
MGGPVLTVSRRSNSSVSRVRCSRVVRTHHTVPRCYNAREIPRLADIDRRNRTSVDPSMLYTKVNDALGRGMLTAQ